MLALVALQLLTLHRIDGRPVYLNPAEITSVGEPHDERGTLHPAGRCVVFLTDRHFFAVKETCDAVLRLLEGK